MSIASNEMSPADIAALTNNNSGDMFGGNAWWLIVLFLFMFAGGGWGGNSGANDNYVLASDMSTISRQIDSQTGDLMRQTNQIANGLCDGFYTQAQLVNGTNLAMANGFANAELSRANQQAAMMAQLTSMQLGDQQNYAQTRYDALTNANATNTAISSGFCTTNYNNATNTRDIIDNQNANSRAILDAINAQATEALKERIAEQAQTINSLQLAASQSAQNQYLISQLRPSPVPAFNVQTPYQYGCSCS